MLRTVRPTANVAKILRWEGIIIDPIGALLAVLVFEFIISETGSGAYGQTSLIFFKTIVLGSLIGGAAGYGFGILIRNHWLPEFLHNICALALVFAVFAVANEIQHESGLLAVTVMGVWLTNMKQVHTEDILNFKESLSILLISGLFIILAARINFARFIELGWQAAGVFLVIQFIARPVKALLATRGTSLTWGERLLIGWIAPRGIVAAATAAVFAVRLQEHGFEAAKAVDNQAGQLLTSDEYLTQAELLVPLTFMVIIGTVVLQSITARAIALRLGVGEPEAKGILIIGANHFARKIATALRECGFEVLLADTSWENIRAARMEGHPTYYGNAVSEHADQHLEIISMGHMLALSEHAEINQLACQRFRTEFGRRSIFSVQTIAHTSLGIRSKFNIPSEGRLLFGMDANIQRLEAMINIGAKIHKTVLTEQYTYQNFLQNPQQNAIPLFAIKPNGVIEFFALNSEISPKPNWMVVSLV